MSTEFDGKCDVYNERLVRARKPHRCSACGPWRYESVGGGVRYREDGTAYRVERRRIDSGPLDPATFPIQSGDVYSLTTSLYAGTWETVKRCARCEAMYQHLVSIDDSGWDWGIQRDLGCGHSYEYAHDREPPPHVQALAFWRPGDPIPTEEASR